ncbi:MAG: type II toxin-antitoxin system RelE/ParE family toxin [Synergistaceae bacterium]|jgi:toxin ParE1/3/4|nr:type II toxin-antitoxin system RelE/ParE family toxin [Synergistaceae bacterium]
MTERHAAKSAKYVILKEARHDLLDIRRFTVENWGKEQSAAYIDELKEVFALLAMNPAIGYDRNPELKRGIKSFLHRSHVIYYKKTDSNIAIIGIFHHSMIPDSHIRKREAGPSSGRSGGEVPPRPLPEARG